MTKYFDPEVLIYELQKRKVFNKLPKVIIDCGAGLPEHCSNSLPFIQLGWDAYLIDGLQGNVDYCEQFYKDNDKVKCLQAILSDIEEPVYFEQNKYHWSLSGVKEGEPNSTTSRLSKIIDALGIKEIGIISLDLEGNETKVLTDLLKAKIYPHVLIVEGNDLRTMQQHRSLLGEQYSFFAGVFPNQYFLLNQDHWNFENNEPNY
jgi:FkbM family methyltransferase